MTKILSILVAMLFLNLCYSQDTVVMTTKRNISAKITEVTSSEIKYKNIDTLNSPTFSVLKSEVIKIIYEDGTTDIFNEPKFEIEDELLKTTTTNSNELTKKGNKVYIEIPDELSQAGEKYFIELLIEWGFWNVVKSKSEANFIVVFHLDKKSIMGKSVYLIFKNRQEEEFQKSKSYSASPNALNAYNASRAVTNKIVEKYLKKEFK